MDLAIKKQVQKVLRSIMRLKAAQTFFNRPVDPDALGIPEYRDIVKEPMDLGTIMSNLNNSKYTSISEVLRDVNKVWDNCQKFNQTGSDVYNASVQLSMSFQKEWDRCKLSVDQGVRNDGAKLASESHKSKTQPKGNRGAQRGRPSHSQASGLHKSTSLAPQVMTQQFQQDNPEMKKVKLTVKASGKGSHGRPSGARQGGKLTGMKRSALNVAMAQTDGEDIIHSRRARRVNYNEDDESGEGQSSASYELPALKPSRKSAMSAGAPVLERSGMRGEAGGHISNMQKQDLNEFPALIKQSHPLHRCLLILDHILSSNDARSLARARKGNLHIDLEGVRDSLAPGLEHGWGMVKYKSTAEVLREIAFVLKSMLVANKSHAHYSQACNKIFGEVRRGWQFAGLHQDLNQLRASVGIASSSNQTISAPRSPGTRTQGKEHSRGGVGAQAQHGTKPRKGRGASESCHHDTMPGSSSHLDKIREEVQKAREELDAITIQKAKALQELHEKDRWSQAKVAEIQKQYNAASKQMEKVAGAREVAKSAAHNLQDAHRRYEMILHHQADLAANKEAGEKLEIHPENARIVDQDAFWEQREPVLIPGNLLNMGNFWFGGSFRLPSVPQKQVGFGAHNPSPVQADIKSIE